MLKKNNMKKIFTLTSLAMITSLSLAACGGGAQGGSSSSNSLLPSGPSTSSTAKAAQTFTFLIPMGTSVSKLSKNPLLTQSIARRLMYVSPDTGGISLFYDGNSVLNNLPVPDVAGTTPSSTPITGTVNLSNGQSIAYSAITVENNDVTYYQVTAVADLLPGSHTLGVVAEAADGFVLSEAQNTYLLTGGANPPATIFLRPVADSAFLCDANCDGHAGPALANGSYFIQAFVSDHEGDTFGWQKNVPLDNGPYSIVENDNGNGLNNNIVSIASTDNGTNGPFTDGGADNVLPANGSGVGSAGHNIIVTCLKVGNTTISTQLSPSGPSAGPVNGFTYTNLINTSADPVNPGNGTPFPVTQTSVYTTPGMYIGTVPTFQDYGNQLAISCDANLSITVE